MLDRSRGEWGEPADDVTSMSINYLFFSLCRHGTLKGPLEVLFHSFWDRYLSRSHDQDVLTAAGPFLPSGGWCWSTLVSEVDPDAAAKNSRFIECAGRPAFRSGRCESVLRLVTVKVAVAPRQ